MKKLFIGQYRFCDFITMCGTFSAILGIILVLNGFTVAPFILLLACSIFDSIDGLFARKRKNTDFENEKEQIFASVFTDPFHGRIAADTIIFV